MASHQEGLQNAAVQNLSSLAANDSIFEMGQHLAGQPIEINRMLRRAQDASCRGTAIAAAVGRALFVGIAILVITVGTLSARSRLPTEGQSTNTWHTAKITRMAEFGSDRASSPQIEDGRSNPPKVIPQPRAYSPIPELALPNLTDASPQHALRAPPRG